jgi:hypothetical protein
MAHDTITTTIELLTLEESAQFAGVSERTIQRHTLLSRHNPTSTTTRKGKKVKGYRKDWLRETFLNEATTGDTKNDKGDNPLKNVVTQDDNLKQSTKNQANKSRENDEIVLILKEEVNFLRTEIGVKNEQICKLQESEKNTKTLLADLQIQNKALQLPSQKNEPTAKRWGKNWQFWLWVAIFFLISLAVSAYAYNYYFGFENLIG